jgi:hypothetical protein
VALFVGILSTETAVVEHYVLAFDIETKTPATEAETVLTFPRRDIFELLDLMPARTVVGIAAKSGRPLPQSGQILDGVSGVIGKVVERPRWYRW